MFLEKISRSPYAKKADQFGWFANKNKKHPQEDADANMNRH